MACIAKDAVNIRTLAHGMTVRELVVDQLLLRSAGDEGAVTISAVVQKEVDQLWALCQTIFHAAATAEEAVRLADRLYVRMDELLAIRRETIPTQGESEPEAQSLPAPRSSEDLSDNYRPMENWDYRGAMDPQWVGEREDSSPQQAGASQLDGSNGGGGLSGDSGGSSAGGTARSHQTSDNVLVPGRRQPTLIEEVLAVEGEGPLTEDAHQGAAKADRYHEWDAAIRDYRTNWCRVVER